MIPHKPLRKQRKTLACSFCRLRKKKCDRIRPRCTYCVKNSNDSCVYSSTTTTTGFITSNIGSRQNTAKYVFVDFSSNEGAAASSNKKQRKMDNINIGESNSNILIREFSPSNSTPSSTSPIEQQNKNGSLNSDEKTSIVLNAEMDRIRNKLIDLEYNSYMQRSNRNGIALADNEIIDLKSAKFAVWYYRVNSIVCFKPFSVWMVTSFDNYFKNITITLNSAYRRFKSKLKSEHINSNSKLFLTNMPKSLHEGFQANTFVNMFRCLVNVNHPDYEFNYALLLSTCQAKLISKSISFGVASDNEEERGHLVREIQNLLPRLDIILFLWDIYKKFVYPFIPILDLNSFEQDLEVLIVGLVFSASRIEKEQSDYKILVTTFVDFANLGTFLIALRISYLCLKVSSSKVNVSENPIEHEILNVHCLNFIGAEYYTFAVNCLLESKYMSKTGFNVILLLLHLLYYSKTCEEGGDVLDTGNNEVFIGMINNHASQTGLFYTDMTSSNFISSNVVVSYAGINSNTIEQFRRNLLVILNKFFIIESACSGFPISIINSERQSMDTMKLDFIGDNIRPMIFEGYNAFKEFGKTYQDLNSFVYRESHNLKLKKLYTFILKFDVCINEKYTLNPVEYFLNNNNFRIENDRNIPEKEKVYQLTLNKVYNFENYLLSVNMKFKITCMLFFQSEKQCLEHHELKNNALHYLKYCLEDIIIGIELIQCYYIMRNYDFLNLSVDADLKNFNHHLIRYTSETGYGFRIFLTGILYRLFNSIHILNKRRLNNEEIDENIRKKLIDLKNNMLSCYSLILGCFSEFPGLYYYKTSRIFLFFNRILEEFRIASSKLDNGESFILTGFCFPVDDDEMKDIPEKEFYNLEPERDEVFLYFDEYILDILNELFLKLGNTLSKNDHQNNKRIVKILGDNVDITQFENKDSTWIEQQVEILNSKEKSISGILSTKLFYSLHQTSNE